MSRLWATFVLFFQRLPPPSRCAEGRHGQEGKERGKRREGQGGRLFCLVVEGKRNKTQRSKQRMDVVVSGCGVAALSFCLFVARNPVSPEEDGEEEEKQNQRD